MAEKLKTESTQKAELTAALTKKDEKLKKKEKLLNEQTQSQIAMEKELDTLKTLVLSQQNLIQILDWKRIVLRIFVLKNIDSNFDWNTLIGLWILWV